MYDYHKLTIFESFNARRLSAKQVAKTFVPPEFFEELSTNNHHILVGPRGSGKTTLFKMMTLPAFLNWEHEDAKLMCKKLNVTSAFIATDIVWEEQWKSIEDLHISSEAKESIRDSIITTYTVRAILKAYMYRVNNKELSQHEHLSSFFIKLPRTEESRLVSSIAKLFKIDISVPSLKSIDSDFADRISTISSLINTIKTDKSLPRIEEYSFIDLNFLPSINAFITKLNMHSNEKLNKWCLLFDELEIAPKEMRKTLLKSLRSTDENLIFKLALSPYSEEFNVFSEPTGPSEGNDFKVIKLWYSEQKHMRRFSFSLFEQLCEGSNITDVNQEDIFGRSLLVKHENNVISDIEEKVPSSVYKKGSALQKAYAELYKKDKSFKQYMDSSAVNINNLNENKKAFDAIVRKIRNIIRYRNELRDENGNIRSRKTNVFYHGFPALFDITEGNPRQFLGAIAPLVKEYSSTKKRISTEKQDEVIGSITKRYSFLLKSFPDKKDSNGTYGIYGLLDQIGKYIFNNIVKDDFKPLPNNKIIVDENTPKVILDVLGHAVNVGAIIYLPTKSSGSSDGTISDLRGKVFRLSNMLAPKYKIPMYKFGNVKLSRILNNGKELNESSLFDDEEKI